MPSCWKALSGFPAFGKFCILFTIFSGLPAIGKKVSFIEYIVSIKIWISIHWEECDLT